MKSIPISSHFQSGIGKGSLLDSDPLATKRIAMTLNQLQQVCTIATFCQNRGDMCTVLPLKYCVAIVIEFVVIRWLYRHHLENGCEQYDFIATVVLRCDNIDFRCNSQEVLPPYRISLRVGDNIATILLRCHSHQLRCKRFLYNAYEMSLYCHEINLLLYMMIVRGNNLLLQRFVFVGLTAQRKGRIGVEELYYLQLLISRGDKKIEK